MPRRNLNLKDGIIEVAGFRAIPPSHGDGTSKLQIKDSRRRKNALGEIYTNPHYNLPGLGLRKDFQKSHEWYQKAFDQKNIEAPIHFGCGHERGNWGFTKDLEAAYGYFLKAADQGTCAPTQCGRDDIERGNKIISVYFKKRWMRCRCGILKLPSRKTNLIS